MECLKPRRKEGQEMDVIEKDLLKKSINYIQDNITTFTKAI